MRLLVPLLLLALSASGCTSDPDDDDGNDGSDGPSDGLSQDRDGYREGVVFFESDYTVSSLQPTTFAIDVDHGALDIILEIRQDSGVLPNLHVEVSGCGGVDPSASAGWQGYLVCAEPHGTGDQNLAISIRGGVAASGSGRVLLRADIPDT